MAALVFALGFVAAYGLCALFISSFRRAFLAVPGERSSHSRATPQGGGLIVTPVALALASIALWSGAVGGGGFVSPIDAALILLMALGAWDDRAPLSPAFRFLVQGLAALIALTAIPGDFAIALPPIPPALVSAALLIGVLWFINLTNFMDGIDLMSVSQFVPAFATFYWLLAGLGEPANWLAVLCLAYVGALLGFAMLNRPPARLFLGDSGSLPLGLTAAVATILVASVDGPLIALLPTLYYLADATLTLARRIFGGEKFWQAHRDHFYQRATRQGLTTWAVIVRVGACNAFLCALALAAARRAPIAQAAAFAAGAALVAWLMRDLARKRA